MSVFMETVSDPPYCGVPSVSHQLPVLVVVAVTLAPAVVVVEADTGRNYYRIGCDGLSGVGGGCGCCCGRRRGRTAA